eukprot:CAMPEP_0194045366 /NCGR_PEP_ID=MMETSP0009_2-20130614/16721_1 /TAXON_ID=210454 /ORGANISM="Grammatophora oceanica, Strain CCMP 410" /LENGTH=423 /DNA_ID=CAMNT_0038690205 /DNA_START=302 /DNA_END=1573 /DNA_ORIENTATION=-
MKLKKLFKRRNKRKDADKFLVDTVPPGDCRMARSLGVGLYDDDYKVTELILAQLKASGPDRDTTTAASITSLDVFDAYEQNPGGFVTANGGNMRSPIKHVTETFERVSSAFLRVADLQIHSSARHLLMGRTVVHPNYHHPSSDAPPGVDHDPKEEWVALDDGCGATSPIAPYAIAALCEFGLKTALDEGMWKGESHTNKFWKNAQESWEPLVWPARGIVGPIKALPTIEPDTVLVWSGNFMHGYYGSDLPAIRAAGLVNMSPRALVDMLMDSTRVKEYNTMSLGRKDMLVLQEDMDPDGPFRGITKIVQSETQPPMIRKTVQFTTILHARKLPNDGGYLLISRAVHHGAPSILDSNIIRSEILMGLNVIRSIEGEPNQSFMINVNHIRSPLIPFFVAKKLGLSAASNFIVDMRETGAKKVAAK